MDVRDGNMKSNPNHYGWIVVLIAILALAILKGHLLWDLTHFHQWQTGHK
jgi:hypothetical protein